MIELREAAPDDLAYLAAHMRKADVDEVMALGGVDPMGALQRSVEHSLWAKVATVDDVPAVIFGVAPLNWLAGIGAPWLLGTDAVSKNRKTFVKLSEPWRDEMHRHFPKLTNVVDARNRVSIRWLKALDFSFSEPFAIRGTTAHLFERQINV